MTMLLGPRLTHSVADTRKTGEPIQFTKGPQLLCRKCGTTFGQYKGMKRVGNGVGYCPDHNPKEKQDANKEKVDRRTRAYRASVEAAADGNPDKLDASKGPAV